MTTYWSLGTMGRGKTLFATNMAKEYSERNPNNKIYANYKLKLPNFVYTPFFFFPLSKISDSLIIGDDMKALETLKRFVSIVANTSRKLNLDIILTAQFYTMIPPACREIFNYQVIPYYTKKNDLLKTWGITPDGKVKRRDFHNAVKNVKHLFDTKEVVKVPSEKIIKYAIMYNSEYLEDLEFNLYLYTGDKRVYKRLMKDILEVKDFEYSREYIKELEIVIGKDISTLT